LASKNDLSLESKFYSDFKIQSKMKDKLHQLVMTRVSFFINVLCLNS
jgi:hypothetical protein